jgi:hypothetical protein
MTKKEYPLISPMGVVVCIVIGLVCAYGVYMRFFN